MNRKLDGWGTVPTYLARDDLRASRIMALTLRSRSPEAMRVPLYVIHRADAPPGPAGQWVIDWLRGSMPRRGSSRS